MAPKSTKKPPDSLGKHGRKQWKLALEEFNVTSEHNFNVLEHACRMLDVAADARDQVAQHGLLVKDRFGQLRENPAAATERQAP